MKKLILGLGLLIVVSTSSMAEQGLGIGGSYIDGLSGLMVKYEWMFSKYVGLDFRGSYLIGYQDTTATSDEKQYEAGQLVRVYTTTQDKDSLGGARMNTTAIPLEIGIKVACPLEQWIPYLLLGGGYYMYDGNVATSGWAPDLSPENVFGFWGAVGVDAKLSANLVLFAEVKYANATWKVEEDYSGSFQGWGYGFSPDPFDYAGTVTAEGGLDGIGGNIGILWKF